MHSGRCSAECVELLRCAAPGDPSLPPATPRSSGSVRMLTWGFGSDGRLGHGAEDSLCVAALVAPRVVLAVTALAGGSQPLCKPKLRHRLRTLASGVK